MLKDIGTCQRTLELAKELWNVLKNFGICSRTSEVKLCLVLELASLELGRSQEYTDKFYNYTKKISYTWILDQGGGIFSHAIVNIPNSCDTQILARTQGLNGVTMLMHYCNARSPS